MNIESLKERIPQKIFQLIEEQGRTELRPSQHKSISAGLFDYKNILVCTPTASGKTYVAELAMLNAILSNTGKAIYIVPLKALASEKYNEFKEKYGQQCSVGISIGDSDSAEPHLAKHDIIICTAEKLDSLMRHQVPWIKEVKVVVIDEIHLLNDTMRGPTLEIVITILKTLLKDIQFIGLSATIGNPKELAQWLDANLVEDTWRPTKLHEGILYENKIEFFER